MSAVVAFNLSGLVDNYQEIVGNSLLGYDLTGRLSGAELFESILDRCDPAESEHDHEVAGLGPFKGGCKRLQFFLVMYDLRLVRTSCY